MKTWKLVTIAVGIPLIMLTTLLTGLGIAGCHFARSMEEATKINTELSVYQDRLRDWKSTGLVQHFPTSIPTDAKDATFVESPGFLQADPYIQLRLVLPEAEVLQLQDDLAGRAMRVQAGGGDRRDHIKEPGGVATTFYRTAPPSQSDLHGVFPPGYTFYILSAMDTSGTGTWSQGRCAGIAIDPATCEVVYWAEQW